MKLTAGVLSGRIRGPSLLIGITFALLVSPPRNADAQIAEHSHFRYSHITWVATGTSTAVITVESGWRRNAYVGTASDGFAAVGDTITENLGGTRLDFGDGSFTGTLRYVVTSINETANWLIGVALDPITNAVGITHTYSTVSGSYVASLSSCCRTGTEVNNPNGSYRVATLIDFVSRSRSPISQQPPIQTCPINGCSFLVPVAQADGHDVRFRLASSTEAGSVARPFQQPPGLTVDPIAGIVSWTPDSTATLGLYSTSVVIETFDTGTLTSLVMVDFLLDLTSAVNSPPAFVPPTPAAGSTFQIDIGDSLQFNVAAVDADQGDTVTIGHLGLPAGATLTPDSSLVGDSVQATFTFIPSTSQSGQSFIVTFTATDQGALTTSTAVTLTVSALPLRGDVNLDGKVSPIDAQAILADLVGNPLPSGFVVSPNGDADCDGALTVNDALEVLKFSIGLPTTSCVGTKQ